ncbi:NIPSNAP family protein [soil metagenome]
MERLLEIRTYRVREGERETFGRRMAAAVPMLRRYGIDVVGHGPSIEDRAHYVLLRSFASLEDRAGRERVFYDGDEWRSGPREGIVELIEAYHTVVLRSTAEAVHALAASLETRDPPAA